MRKKFLKSAAAFSIAAAACIMSGLVTASADTVSPDKVSVDYENQRVIVTLKAAAEDAKPEEVTETLLGNLIDQVIKKNGQLLKDAKDGDTIDLVASGQNVDFGNPAEYVVGGKKVKGVTITVAQTTAGTGTADVLNSDGLTLKADVSSIAEEDKSKLPSITVTATVKVEKDGTEETVTATKDITLTIGEKSTSSDKADKEIMFGVSTMKNNVVKTPSWEVHDIGNKDKVEIDISSLNTQKDNYMQIKGDVSADPLTIFIPKTDKTVKLKYNPAKHELEKKAGESATAAYEYRTQYGSWQTFGTIESGVDLSLYQEKGATLYFRLDTAKDKMAVSAGDKLDSLKDADGNGVAAYKVDALPGKEIKVAIAKKANGPKATADFVKQTVTVPAGSQYRVVDPTAAAVPTVWTASDSKTVLSGDKLPAELFKENAALEVMKKATDTKAESKIFRLEFPNAKEEIADAKGEVDSTGATLTDAAGKTVTFKMTKTGSGNKQKDVLEIVNNTDDQYQVYIGAAVPENGKGVKAVKKGGKTLKFTSPADKAKVWVRKTGDKKSLTWSTDYKDIGAVTIPVDTPVDPDVPQEAEEVEVTKEILNELAAELAESNVTVPTTAKANDEINICKADKTINFEAASDYTFNDGKRKVTGIEASLEIDVSSTQLQMFVEVNSGTKKLTIKTPNSVGDVSGTVNLTLKKGSISSDVYPIAVAYPKA